MKENITGKVCLVTGAGRGIGRSIAIRLAQLKCHVMLVSRTESELLKVQKEINGEAEYFVGDVSKEKTVEELIDFTQRKLGYIDILVNNAGATYRRAFVDTTLQDLNEMLEANLITTFLCTQAVLTSMKKRNTGRIINIVSTAAHKVYQQQSAYCVAKHAVLGLTKALALEVRDTNIIIQAISPGGVDSKMVRDAGDIFPEDAWLQPEDIADAVEMLLFFSKVVAIDEFVIRRKDSIPWEVK
jgi:NAD(P)-dependent dehydrogenase (short-subunit alcohol dehydrogenase family)